MILTLKGADFSRENIGVLEDHPGGSTGAFGKKLYTFGVLSDIHIGYESRGGTADFQRALPALENLGAQFIGIAGDVGYYSDSSSQESELITYKQVLNDYATVPVYTCTGNHDIAHTDALWEQYTGKPKNFEIVQDGDVFLFMSLSQSTKASSHDTPYTTNLTWLKERLNYHKGKRMFVFMHYPISNYSGLRDDEYYGFSSGSTEDDDLLSTMLGVKNVVAFHGHTHFKFDCETDYYTINVFNFPHKKVSLVHVPSCAYPRNSSKTEEADLSEGYIVEAYDKGIIIHGVNLVTGEYMSDYTYELVMENATGGADNAIIVSTTDISLESGESAEFLVSLANPANATVRITETNDSLTTSPTSLTFTEENYNIPQAVTVTAGELDTSESVLVTVSANGLSSKKITVSLTHQEIATTVVPAGQNIPVNGTIYGGECGASNEVYQLYDNKTAGDFDFGIYNLSLKSSQTALYFAAAGSTVDISVQGTNIIDVSDASSTSQRGVSSSATSGNYLTGIGENASLTIKADPDAKTEAIKGNWVIENVSVAVTGTDDPAYNLVETVVPSSSGAPAGITLRRSGAFSLNGMGVQLLPCTGGYIEANLGTVEAGNTIIITAYPDSGYTYTGDTTATIIANGILTIQGQFIQA